MLVVSRTMTLEQDYRVLARFLVRAHGDGALEYARRYTEESSNSDAETERMWLNVSRAVEQVIASNGKRRKSDRVAC